MKKIIVSALTVALSVGLFAPSFTSAAQLSTTNSNSTSLQQLASTGGYKYVTTFRTKKSAYKIAGSTGLSAAGLVGGPAGAIATIAGTLLTLSSYTDKEVYIEIVQYYNQGTQTIKNTYRYYKNPDYTGLISTSTTESRIFS
ncbi:hypothetical protein [Paenibacillus sp. WLX2291]|uniref:hypothetical protein n=1 Tax=Paenibacillus sp. WLX2291 TaxID=3296934 RepID=UPI003984390F